jgi:hypothetical protein
LSQRENVSVCRKKLTTQRNAICHNIRPRVDINAIQQSAISVHARGKQFCLIIEINSKMLKSCADNVVENVPVFCGDETIAEYPIALVIQGRNEMCLRVEKHPTYPFFNHFWCEFVMDGVTIAELFVELKN